MKKEKKEILDKKTLKKLKTFIVNNKITKYNHRENNLDINLKYLGDYTKNHNMPKIMVKILIFCITFIFMTVVVTNNFIDIAQSTIISEGGVLILIGVIIYFVALLVYEIFIKKERHINVTNIIEKNKSYYDSTFKNHFP